MSSNGSPLVSGRNYNIGRYELFNATDCPTHEEVFVTRKSAFLPNDTLTVRCRIWSLYIVWNLSNDEFVSCCSRCETTNYSFLWTVSEFSALQLNQEVTTPITILSSVLPSDDFLLKFSFKGVSLEEADTNFKLTRVSTDSPMLVIFKVSVLVNEKKVTKIMESNSKYFQPNSRETWVLSNFITRKELLKVKSNILRYDALTFRCEIPTIRYACFIEKYYYGTSNMEVDITKETSIFSDASCQTSDQSHGTLVVPLHREDPLAYLGEDLLALYQEQRLTDFELRAGDVSFPVHKTILSARSPVFKAMFSSEMKESDSNFQDVPDLDVHTLNRLLTFLYGGTVEQQLQWKGAAKLYYAADKYQVQSLKQQCSSILRSNITVSNVSEILKLADRHQDNELISFTHEFVLSQFDEIMQSKEWENFVETDSYLAAKTVHQLCKKKLLTKRI